MMMTMTMTMMMMKGEGESNAAADAVAGEWTKRNYDSHPIMMKTMMNFIRISIREMTSSRDGDDDGNDDLNPNITEMASPN